MFSQPSSPYEPPALLLTELLCQPWAGHLKFLCWEPLPASSWLRLVAMQWLHMALSASVLAERAV